MKGDRGVDGGMEALCAERHFLTSCDLATGICSLLKISQGCSAWMFQAGPQISRVGKLATQWSPGHQLATETMAV